MIEPGTTQGGPLQIENASGTVINPATEGTLQNVAGFNIAVHDYLKVTYPTSVTEVYTFKVGGAGGTTVNTLTVVYLAADKSQLDTVTKT